jgi:hypothetical protein
MSNYTERSTKTIKTIIKLVYESYKQCDSISTGKNNNLIGLLFHEIVRYFSTIVARNEIYCHRKAINIGKDHDSDFMDDVIRFGYRDNVHIHAACNKKNIKRDFVNLFFKFIGASNKPKLYLGDVSINNYSILFLCFRKKYQLVYLDNDQKAYISNHSKQKEIALNLLKRISNMLGMDNFKDLYNDFEYFINTCTVNKKVNFSSSCDVVLIGTPAKIKNRIASINGFYEGSKVIGVLHSDESGMMISDSWYYDDRSFCDYLIGYGPLGRILKDKRIAFSSLSGSIPAYFESDSEICRKIYSKKDSILESYSNLLDMKGLYVSGRIGNISTINSNEILEIIDPADYIRWQHFLLSKFPNVDIKTHPKGKCMVNYKNKHSDFGNINNISVVIDKYDFFIIDNLSTASNILFATSKPILFFNLGCDNVSEESFPFFEKRVLIVDIKDLKSFSDFDNYKLIRNKTKLENKLTPLISLSTNKISRIEVLKGLL